MDAVCLRLDRALAKQIERDMADFKYSTKTEFIREAIRDKLKTNDKERAWNALFALRGALKGKGRFKTDEEWHDWRSTTASEELKKYYEKKFGINQK